MSEIKQGESWRNKKHNRIYTVQATDIINATNAQNGELMVLYYHDINGPCYVRSKTEFLEKFEKVQ